MSEPMSTSIDTPVPTPDAVTAPSPPSRRRRPNPFVLVAAGLAAVLLAAMSVVMFCALSDQDRAEQERRDATAELRDARKRAAGARAMLAFAQLGGHGVLGVADDVGTTIGELAHLAGRELELATVTQDAGANDGVNRVDEYNDAISRGTRSCASTTRSSQRSKRASPSCALTRRSTHEPVAWAVGVDTGAVDRPLRLDVVALPGTPLMVRLSVGVGCRPRCAIADTAARCSPPPTNTVPTASWS